MSTGFYIEFINLINVYICFNFISIVNCRYYLPKNLQKIRVFLTKILIRKHSKDFKSGKKNFNSEKFKSVIDTSQKKTYGYVSS